jgi:hypothetical protein
MDIHSNLNKVYWGNALDLLQTMPGQSVDSVISDAMYGVSKHCRYEWGLDPARGDPVKHWAYHEPIYQECRRVLRPGGVLAWAQAPKFSPYFFGWFRGHRIWSLTGWVLATKYYHDPVTGYRHGNFYVLSPLVTRDQGEKKEEAEVSTISLPPSFFCHDEDDLELLAVRCQRCEIRFGRRLAQLFEQKRAA